MNANLEYLPEMIPTRREDPLASIIRRSMFWAPERVAKSAWSEHVPFAFWLVDALRPLTIVELGTQTGVSYSAMCQAVRSLSLPTRCFAIDPWKGDEHAGYDAEKVYREFAAFHDARYSAFSRLIRSTFDEALGYFEDRSIDLLHIDGLHTYEAVRHDFESWRPKLSSRAIVLLHHTNVREDNFGVFRFWRELAAEQPHFSFLHGHGLGVLALGEGYSDPLDLFMAANNVGDRCSLLRDVFASLGRAVRLASEGELAAAQAGALDTMRAQLAARDAALEAVRAQLALREAEAGSLTAQLAVRDALVTAFNALGEPRKTTAVTKTRTGLQTRAVSSGPAPARPASRISSLKARLHWLKRLLVQLNYSAPGYGVRMGHRAIKTGSLAPLRDWRATGAIARSGLFDRDWYCRNNPDVVAWGIDPLRHYMLRGASIGREPNGSFHTRSWLADNPAAAISGLNPLAYLVRSGEMPGTASADPESEGATSQSVPPRRAAPAEKVFSDGMIEWSDHLPLRRAISENEIARIGSLDIAPAEILELAPEDFASTIDGLAMPAFGDVLVSIIIPVFNNLKLTLECLKSIEKYTGDSPTFEVIVADDASADDTALLLPKAKNLRYLRNAQNLGFLRNCNEAAKSARGRYLLFLNNDVQVTQGWLSALASTFAEYPDTGVAGPKIVYPAGRLQEAGARLNRDATSQLIGLNDDPSLPRFNCPREVDYCSGACLMVEAARFWQVGGFSEDFAPAYCEDADLCLKLRAQGLQTVYNPAAVIIHHLSKSTDDVDPTFKMRCIAANQQKLSERWQAELDRLNEVRVIAFYLPQFHSIPENDRWWGKGFTEWSNVIRATPNFPGHYQPRRPADLGYYDLHVPEVMEAQAALARSFGVHGFCYYYYWFGGKRLLEMPLERMLQTGQPDFPFCLCWANENWSRRWDGLDADVLMAQQHSDDDDAAIIHDLIRYFGSRNYIRIKGRPLILVYRVDLFPDFSRTAAIWRDVCRREGVGEICLAMVGSFDLSQYHPATFGCDVMVEFPPHGGATSVPTERFDFTGRFEGEIYDYREYALSALGRPLPPFTRFRTVMPSWDNTPRRQNRSHIFVNSSPGAFQAWLETAMQHTREQNAPDQRLVFVNAWNEWGESAYLEPDMRFGSSYLQAIRNAHDSWQLAAP